MPVNKEVPKGTFFVGCQLISNLFKKDVSLWCVQGTRRFGENSVDAWVEMAGKTVSVLIFQDRCLKFLAAWKN